LLTHLETSRIYFAPDSSGGIWILYEDYVLLSNRPKIQHVDAAGNKLLGPEGMFVMNDTLSFGYVHGLQPLPNGDVMAVYDRWGDDNGTNYLYGQRFQPDGQPLFDAPGAQITTDHTWDVYCGFTGSTNVCGDGSDGVWCVFKQAFTNHLYYGGLNGDGTQKTNYVSIENIASWYGAICEDGEGGFFVITQCSADNSYSPFCNHINASGSMLAPEEGVRILYEYDIYFIGAVPDGEGGVIVQMDNYDTFCRYQKVSSDLSLPWGNDGLYYAGGTPRFSRKPAHISDNSFVFASVDAGAYDNKIRFGWVSSDGTELVSYTGNVIEEGYLYKEHVQPHVVVIQEGGEEYALMLVHRLRDGEEYLTLHRISDDGTEDLWAANPPEITGGHPGIRFNTAIVNKLSDNTLSVVTPFDTSSTYGVRYLLYKYRTNGQLVGVPESQLSTALPQNVEILSTYPNPFNGRVLISLHLPSAEPLTISVYDLLGQRMDMFTVQPSTSAAFQVSWNPGFNMASGVYFLRAKQGDKHSRVVKTILLR